MIFAPEYIGNFIENLSITISVDNVEEIDGNTKISASNTQYITTSHEVKLDGVYYTVVDFVQDEYFTLKGVSLGFSVNNTLSLAAPTFFHGQFRDTNIEVAQRWNSSNFDRRKFMPMVYLIEPISLQPPSNNDSRFQLDGTVRLFLLNNTKWDNRPSEHYTLNIKPLGAIIDAINNQWRRYFKVASREPITSVRPYPKFVTGNEGLDSSKGEKVFGNYLSGIEIELNAPILNCCNC